MSLYLHIPFCAVHCPYCDFAIHIGGADLHRPYIEAMIRELRFLRAGESGEPALDTVYLGGGTPSLLDVRLLEELLGAVRASFAISPGAEISIEANPTDLSEDKARGWLDLGINRVSLGVQSLDDATLRWLGRNHDRSQALAAIEALRRAGLENLSCDLIYAIPAQSTRVFAAGLRTLLTYGPAHISCYELTVEAGTPLARSVARGRVKAPREQDFLEQHRLARAMLEDAGLPQYEVSNYARPGRESRHNLGYWQGGHYLAAGCGAHGFVSPEMAGRWGVETTASAVGVRYWNLRNASSYINQVADRGHGRRGQEEIDEAQREAERLACGLRLRHGVELCQPQQLAAAEALSRLGLLTLAGNRVAATTAGIEVLDRITLELVARDPVALPL
ncbi:MAG: radical SAM family heme chaperone HemW [Candidatus Dormiibacterota bacterium]